MDAAGFIDVECRSLAIEAAAIGRPRSGPETLVDEAAVMARERALSSQAVLADCGLDLLALGRKSGRTS